MDIIIDRIRGSLAKIDLECKTELENLQHDSKYKDAFVEQGFWIGEAHDELDEIRQLNYEAKFKQKELRLTLKLTDDCNFRCTYCYQPHSPGTLDSSKLNVIKKYIKRMVNDGIETVSIHLFGGEPTLNLPIASELCEFLKNSSIEHNVAMTSNGYLLSPEVVSEIVRMGVSSIQITLDGPEHIHNMTRHLSNGDGTYETILKNIVNIHETTNLVVIVRTNLTKRNAPFIRELFQDLHSRGLTMSDRIRFFTNEVIKHVTTPNTPDDDDIYFNSRSEYAKESLSVDIISSQLRKNLYLIDSLPLVVLLMSSIIA